MPGKQRFTLLFKTRVPQADDTKEVSFRGAYGNLAEAEHFGKIAAAGSARQLRFLSASPVHRDKPAQPVVPQPKPPKVVKAREYFAQRIARLERDLARIGTQPKPKSKRKKKPATRKKIGTSLI